MKSVVFLLLLSFAFLRCANAPGPDHPPRTSVKKPALPAYIQQFADNYDRYFSDSVRLTHTPGAALVVVKDSQVILLRCFGPRIAGAPDSINAATVFRIGSLSKGFAGVLCGILVQDGVFNWNDPVKKYYPEFTLRDKLQADRIQLWHLLSHTTGLPYHACTNLIERGMDIPHIAKNYLPAAPVCGKEGEFFAYQNVALCLVEEMMRQATGQSYQQLLTEKIFRPAGMLQASCDFEGIYSNPNKTLPHFATGIGTWRADSISRFYYNAAAAGGVNAGIADMGEWLKILLGQRPDIVTTNTLDRVFQPVIQTGKERRIFPQWLPREAASYALGWRVLDDQGDTIIYHGGYVNGYKSEIALNRRDGIGICVLFNAHTPLSSDCIPAFFEQWKKAKLSAPSSY
ncbi:MAG: serine hydrolase domain-containing protein [Saprospiraceae bacterium]|nr:serine hydrolase domain-containing protein [Saprospiraceae bacterium]